MGKVIYKCSVLLIIGLNIPVKVANVKLLKNLIGSIVIFQSDFFLEASGFGPTEMGLKRVRTLSIFACKLTGVFR